MGSHPLLLLCRQGDIFKILPVICVFHSLKHIGVNGKHRIDGIVQFRQKITFLLTDRQIKGLLAYLQNERDSLSSHNIAESLCHQVDLPLFEGRILLLIAVEINHLHVRLILTDPLLCKHGHAAVNNTSHLFPCEGRQIIDRDRGVLRPLVDTILIHTHGRLRKEDRLRPLLRDRDTGHQIDLTGLQHAEQIRPVSVDVLIAPESVVGDLLKIVITVTAFGFLVGGSFLEHRVQIPTHAHHIVTVSIVGFSGRTEEELQPEDPGSKHHNQQDSHTLPTPKPVFSLHSHLTSSSSYRSRAPVDR